MIDKRDGYLNLIKDIVDELASQSPHKNGIVLILLPKDSVKTNDSKEMDLLMRGHATQNKGDILTYQILFLKVFYAFSDFAKMFMEFSKKANLKIIDDDFSEGMKPLIEENNHKHVMKYTLFNWHISQELKTQLFHSLREKNLNMKMKFIIENLQKSLTYRNKSMDQKKIMIQRELFAQNIIQ